MIDVGDIVVMDKPTVHKWWVVYAILNETEVLVVALDANTNPVHEYTERVPISKLTIDNKRIM